MPGDYTADDIRAYQLAYMMGDDDALNGLFSKVKSRIKERREGRAAQKEERRTTRSAKRASKTERRALRNERIRTGGTFLDKLGNVGGGLLKKVAGIGDELGEELDELGVPYDDEVLDQRALRMANEGIEPGDVSEPPAASEGGIMGFWNARSMPQKVAIGAGAAILGYLAYKQFSKKRGRK
jgi:hypothetical protein